MSLIYSIEQVEKIQNNGFKIHIENEFLSNLKGMTDALTIQFNFEGNVFEKEKVIIPEYKPFNVPKTESEKNINDVNVLLNKLTDQNYDVLYDKICDIIDSILTKSENDVHKINEYIFNRGTLKFNCKVFAKLYKDLLKKYKILDGLITKELGTYLENFKHIKSCSPEESYSEFCKLNKLNDERRGLSMFLVELANNDSLDFSYIVSLINDLHLSLDIELMNENSQYTCQEICNNMKIMYECNKVKDIECDLLNEFKNKINNLMKSDPNEKKSFNNKVKFNLMDINDIFKKMKI